ncbi:hypothetical protein ACFTY7_33930 [Streptomyces sp. NPDC057062]|uniref:hypothetical protein n=1 Tax=Streptomyces sp. NPDC057062 TaxID=3346011 RepID=UPI00363B40AD
MSTQLTSLVDEPWKLPAILSNATLTMNASRFAMKPASDNTPRIAFTRGAAEEAVKGRSG